MTTDTKALETYAANTIVAFHIGRGGRFHNSGHVTYLGQEKIGKFVGDLFLSHANEMAFSGRFGFASTGNKSQKCILDLITDEEYDELEEKFGITIEMLGEKVYKDGNGNPIITEQQVNSGIGCINIDNDYDTTYCQTLSDCNDNEIQLIYNEESRWEGHLAKYGDDALLQYCKWRLDIEEEQTEDDE
jgi:hypothetical protein